MSAEYYVCYLCVCVFVLYVQCALRMDLSFECMLTFIHMLSVIEILRLQIAWNMCTLFHLHMEKYLLNVYCPLFSLVFLSILLRLSSFRIIFFTSHVQIYKSPLNRKTFFPLLLNKLYFKRNNFIDSIFPIVRLVRCTLWLYTHILYRQIYIYLLCWYCWIHSNQNEIGVLNVCCLKCSVPFEKSWEDICTQRCVLCSI